MSAIRVFDLAIVRQYDAKGQLALCLNPLLALPLETIAWRVGLCMQDGPWSATFRLPST